MKKMKKKVTLLFTENVYDYLELEADKRGVTVATLCRLIIFENYHKGIRTKEKEAKEHAYAILAARNEKK